MVEKKTDRVGRNRLPIDEFAVSLEGLPAAEKMLVQWLMPVARGASHLFSKQFFDSYPGANVYPHFPGLDARTIQEALLTAAQADPSILSPYTVVQREGGRFTAVPYQIFFRSDFLVVSANLVRIASSFSDFKELSAIREYLKNVATYLTEGQFDRILSDWVQLPAGNINFLFGPIDSYEDSILGVKKSIEATLAFADIPMTRELAKDLEPLRQLADAWWGRFEKPIRVRADEVVIFAGAIAAGQPSTDTTVSGVNYPNESEQTQEYGAKIVIYRGGFDTRFEDRQTLGGNKGVLPNINRRVANCLRYPKANFRRAFQQLILSHELAHVYSRWPGERDRLASMYGTINEVLASVRGLLLQVNVWSSSREQETAVAAFLGYTFSRLNKIMDNPQAFDQPEKILPYGDYPPGHLAALNFLHQEGGLFISGGVARTINLPVFFDKLASFGRMLEQVATEGGQQEAKALITRYLATDILRNNLTPALS